jgi:hypothetical protein
VKKNVWRILLVVFIFACGCIVGGAFQTVRKAEAGTGCMNYIATDCLNVGGTLDINEKAVIQIRFSKPMQPRPNSFSYEFDGGKRWILYFDPK